MNSQNDHKLLIAYCATVLIILILAVGMPQQLNLPAKSHGGGGGTRGASAPTYQFPSLCGPQFEGAVINFAVECFNDSIFINWQVSKADQFGWQYVSESAGDAAGGFDYDILGLAFRETATEIWVVINANMPYPGGNDIANPLPGRDNNINYGDLFINLTGLSFEEANDKSALYAVRFAPNNDSQVSDLGVYKNVKAMSVSIFNMGPVDRAGYERFIRNNYGAEPDYGEYPKTMSYFAPTSSFNVIESGTYAGPIQMITSSTLAAENFDLTKFKGLYTFAFKFDKKLIIDQCGVVGGDGTSCLDCAGVACGRSVKDQCGVCNGDDSTCQDCLGIPNGDALIDQCGVCAGDGTSCLDCAGVPFGKSKVDRCGVCGGNGESCLGCESFDKTSELVVLDGTAAQQYTQLKKALKALSKAIKKSSDSKKLKRWVKQAEVRGEQLHMDNWARAWQLPQYVKSCSNQAFCSESSNSRIINEYIDAAGELYTLTRQALKKLKKLGASNKRNKKIGKTAKKLLNQATRLAGSFPQSTSICSDVQASRR
ncbi:MAG: hypothetical protein D6719_01095 [Candidatus Dadabacteria bacterium]|nr:MAG: hypothetical protein D6719_01095 [Candidatus Dadabacteria bacterium]